MRVHFLQFDAKMEPLKAHLASFCDTFSTSGGFATETAKMKMKMIPLVFVAVGFPSVQKKLICSCQPRPLQRLEKMTGTTTATPRIML